MSQDTISNMRGRIQRCRWLAKQTSDDNVARALRQMADEIEADVKRLEAEATRRRDPEN